MTESILKKIAKTDRDNLEKDCGDKFKFLFANGLPFGISDCNVYGNGVQVFFTYLIMLH